MSDVQNQLEESLNRYEEEIAKLKEIDDVTGLNPYDSPISGMLFYNLDISYLLRSIEEYDINDAQNRYKLLNSQLEAYMKKRTYREQALSELNIRLGDFPSKICYFMELDPYDNEVNLVLSRRDMIEILIMHLKDYFDLERQQLQIRTLDKVFRCRYEMYIRSVEEYAIELPYYPDSFWWRHPSIVAEDAEHADGWSSIWPPIDWERSKTLYVADTALSGEPYRFIAASDRGIFKDGEAGDAINAAYGITSGEAEAPAFEELNNVPNNIELVAVEVAKANQYHARAKDDTSITFAEEAYTGTSPAQAVMIWWADEMETTSPF